MKWTALFAVVALTGCVTAPQVAMLYPTKLTDGQLTKIKTAVTSTLKDPGSASFGNIKAGEDVNGKIFVCGLVNAKNSFGGFTGMTPFGGEFSPSGSFVVGAIGGNPEVSTAIYQVCTKQGLHV